MLLNLPLNTFHMIWGVQCEVSWKRQQVEKTNEGLPNIKYKPEAALKNEVQSTRKLHFFKFYKRNHSVSYLKGKILT